MNQTLQSVYILLGVVAAVIAFGFVTNTIEALLGPWRKLAERFPTQPVRTEEAPDTGEAPMAFAKRKPDLTKPRGGRGPLGCLLTAIAAVGFGSLIFLAVAYFTNIVNPASVWGVVWATSALGWTALVLVLGFRFLVNLRLFPIQVTYTADDEHLHIKQLTSVGTPNPTISIPWAEIESFEADPQNTGAVLFHAGDRWVYTTRAPVNRELAIRGEPIPYTSDDNTPASIPTTNSNTNSNTDPYDAPERVQQPKRTGGSRNLRREDFDRR